MGHALTTLLEGGRGPHGHGCREERERVDQIFHFLGQLGDWVEREATDRELKSHLRADERGWHFRPGPGRHGGRGHPADPEPFESYDPHDPDDGRPGWRWPPRRPMPRGGR